MSDDADRHLRAVTRMTIAVRPLPRAAGQADASSPGAVFSAARMRVSAQGAQRSRRLRGQRRLGKARVGQRAPATAPGLRRPR